jgi:hypothetical protein
MNKRIRKARRFLHIGWWTHEVLPKLFPKRRQA